MQTIATSQVREQLMRQGYTDAQADSAIYSGRVSMVRAATTYGYSYGWWVKTPNDEWRRE